MELPDIVTELNDLFERAKKVSNYQAEDTVLLACCAHYLMNKPAE